MRHSLAFAVAVAAVGAGCPSPDATVLEVPVVEATPAPDPHRDRPLRFDVEVRTAGRTEDLVALEIRFALQNRAREAIVVPVAWFEVAVSSTGLEERSKQEFVDMAHTPWDYDDSPRSRFTSVEPPVIASVGRVLGDLPGGHQLAPGDRIDRTVIVQVPARFSDASVRATAYAWYGEAPIVLCWKTLQDGSGVVLPWVLDEEASTTKASELDPDARVRACREYQKRDKERRGELPEREGGVPSADDDRLVRYLPESHPAIAAKHVVAVAFDRAEVSLWDIDD
jgi:hypothetical protein